MDQSAIDFEPLTNKNDSNARYTRDVGGNVTASAVEDPSSTLELSRTAAYDELGRLLTFVGSASQTSTHAYDKTNNRVSVTDPRKADFAIHSTAIPTPCGRNLEISLYFSLLSGN